VVHSVAAVNVSHRASFVNINGVVQGQDFRIAIMFCDCNLHPILPASKAASGFIEAPSDFTKLERCWLHRRQLHMAGEDGQ
jgi:hypothetical protein